MYTFIAVLIIFASLLLTLVVLVQNSKGGGLAANFAAGNQAFGVRQTADFLEKTTWTLATVILMLALLATMFIPRGELHRSSVIPEQMDNMQMGRPDFSNLPPTTQPQQEQPNSTETPE